MVFYRLLYFMSDVAANTCILMLFSSLCKYFFSQFLPLYFPKTISPVSDRLAFLFSTHSFSNSTKWTEIIWRKRCIGLNFKNTGWTYELLFLFFCCDQSSMQIQQAIVFKKGKVEADGGWKCDPVREKQSAMEGLVLVSVSPLCPPSFHSRTLHSSRTIDSKKQKQGEITFLKCIFHFHGCYFVSVGGPVVAQEEDRPVAFISAMAVMLCPSSLLPSHWPAINLIYRVFVSSTPIIGTSVIYE